eukprot:2779861-Pyramimonas_sp.AAC.1
MLGDLAAAPGSGSRVAERMRLARELCDDAWNHPRGIDARRLLRQRLDNLQAAEEAAYEGEVAKQDRTQSAAERWFDRQTQPATPTQANLTMVFDDALQCWRLLTVQALQAAKGPLFQGDGGLPAQAAAPPEDVQRFSDDGFSDGPGEAPLSVHGRRASKDGGVSGVGLQHTSVIVSGTQPG